MGEAVDALGRLASRLLSRDSVFTGLQRALLSSLDARKKLDRNIERLLAAVNLPSARDLDRVLAQLAELDRDVGELAERARALGEARARTQGRADEGRRSPGESR